MGWNFGCVVIDGNVAAKVTELLEPELQQFVTGAETPEELQSKRLIDLGNLVLKQLELPAVADDAPISFSDATSRYFDGYAVGVVHDRTILLGQRLVWEQDTEYFVEAYSRLSTQFGPVYVFWWHDASGTYMMSTFREGKRIRYFGTGEGIDENHGAHIAGETEIDVHPHDRMIAVLENVCGCSFVELLKVTMERFSAC